MKTVIVSVLAAYAALFYKYFFYLLKPQPLIFDQEQYFIMANNFFTFPWFTSAFRSPGFPALMAVVFRLAGSNEPHVWMTVHAVLEVVTAGAVFGICRLLGWKRSHAAAAFFLYVLNPFTSAYVGVFLTEILTINLVTVGLYLLLGFARYRKPLILIALAFVAGYLSLVKTSLFPFSVLLVISAVFLLLKQRLSLPAKVSALVLLCVFFALPFSYQVRANRLTYGYAFKPFPVDDLFVQNLYASLFVERFLTVRPDDRLPYTQEVADMYSEYSLPKASHADRTAMRQKYLDLSYQEIEKDIVQFVRWRLAKMRYIWEKHSLFYYHVESMDARYISALNAVNGILVLSGFIGLALWIATGKRKSLPEAVFLPAALFLPLYLSAIHAFTMAEERYSLPGYPLLCVFAVYFWGRIVCGRLRFGKVRQAAGRA